MAEKRSQYSATFHSLVGLRLCDDHEAEVRLRHRLQFVTTRTQRAVDRSARPSCYRWAVGPDEREHEACPQHSRVIRMSNDISTARDGEQSGRQEHPGLACRAIPEEERGASRNRKPGHPGGG